MSKVMRAIGFAWAAPLTLLGLIYVILLSGFGWYEWQGRFGNALTWHVVPERAPRWLSHAWHGWAGQAIGNVVVLNIDHCTSRGNTMLRHEQAHVAQAMRLGVLFPFLYAAGYLLACLLPRSYPMYDNVFEIDARRSADQVIDVVGAVKWAVTTGRLKLPMK